MNELKCCYCGEFTGTTDANGRGVLCYECEASVTYDGYCHNCGEWAGHDNYHCKDCEKDLQQQNI